jgi:hypothetical protein
MSWAATWAGVVPTATVVLVTPASAVRVKATAATERAMECFLAVGFMALS